MVWKTVPQKMIDMMRAGWKYGIMTKIFSGNNEEITDSEARRLANLKPWQPGQSGNPQGRPKKKPITEMYERILADADNLAIIEEAVVKALRKGQMAMVLQLSTTVIDRMRAEAIRAFDSGSTWPGIGAVFATGTNAAGVQCRATRATAFR